MDEQLLFSVLMIIGIDLVLGGDNAIVIALACRNLPESQRNKAIVFGTLLAVVLRIILTALAVYLLQIPFLQLIGGLFLLYISFSLMTGKKDENHTIQSHSSLWKAIQTIVMADLVMGLDNVIAIAGAADGHVWLVVFGLVISIPIIVWGSSLLLKVMNRFVFFVYIGGGILAFTAGKMIAEDQSFQQLFLEDGSLYASMPYMTTGFLLCAAIVYRQMQAMGNK